jgi:hypothetical protein
MYARLLLLFLQHHLDTHLLAGNVTQLIALHRRLATGYSLPSYLAV